MGKILKAEDFFNKFFYISLFLGLALVLMGWYEGILFETIIFVLLSYFMFLLAIVMILNTQHWWNSSSYTGKVKA